MTQMDTVPPQMADQHWFGLHRQMPPQAWATSYPPASVNVYFDGDATFNVHFSPAGGAEFTIWTTAEGLEAVIASCHAALVRARIQQEATA
jgi:hypothetical protein